MGLGRLRHDVALSYKLLRMVNSAAMGGRDIWSIGHALRLLGRAQIARWLGILLVTDGDHMARALPLFERAGFEVLPAPVFDTVYDAAGPEDRLSTSRSMLMELGARLYYRAAGYL